MRTDQFNQRLSARVRGTSIGVRDAKTGIATIYQTHQELAAAAGRVDGQNRLWFAEFGGNAIGLFDPKTAGNQGISAADQVQPSL